MKVAAMTLARQTSTVNGDTDRAVAVHLLLTEGHADMMAENPEHVMQEIELRATQVSSVLEGILLEPHGRPDWGLNE